MAEDTLDALSLGGSVSVSGASTATLHPRLGGFKSHHSRINTCRAGRLRQLLQRQKQARRDQLALARALLTEESHGATAAAAGPIKTADPLTSSRTTTLTSPLHGGETCGRRRTRETKKKKKEADEREAERRALYRDQLTQGEWLVDVPEDFEEMWQLVPCPVGQRVLVIASHGRTHVHVRSGRCVHSFSSMLPGGGGGGGCDGGRAGGGGGRGRGLNKNCVLDCVWNRDEGIFYILDVMAWCGQPFWNADFAFRSFWLQSKLDEAPELFFAASGSGGGERRRRISSINNSSNSSSSSSSSYMYPAGMMTAASYTQEQQHQRQQQEQEQQRQQPKICSSIASFIGLPRIACTREAISSALFGGRASAAASSSSAPLRYDIEGLLFYHIEGHYHAGENPCVAWLTCDLLSSVLGIEGGE